VPCSLKDCCSLQASRAYRRATNGLGTGGPAGTSRGRTPLAAPEATRGIPPSCSLLRARYTRNREFLQTLNALSYPI